MESSKKLLITIFVVGGLLLLNSCAKRKEVKQEAKITVPPPETTHVYTPKPVSVETTKVTTQKKKQNINFEGPVVVFESNTGKKKDTVQVVLPQEVAIVSETTAAIPKTTANQVPIVTPPENEQMQTQEPEKTFGYRVQIFATLKKENAQRVANEAKKILSKPVYIEYIPPFYKVRVGDFKSRDDAEEYKEYLRANGYPDAFVVETEIKVH